MPPESMTYTLLGDDRSSDADKLAKFSGEVGWAYLRPHYRNGALFFVDPALELGAVGAAIAADDTTAVRAWMRSGDLVRIDHLHARHWETADLTFEVLVVSPFVLCRPVQQDTGDQDAPGA